MSAEIVNRQPQGIPVGGQFAAAIHTEPGVSLSAPATGLALDADFRDDLSPEHRKAIDHWHGRLQDAGVAGKLRVLSLDGSDSDPGGPTVCGTWHSPDGTDFGFAVDHKNIELTRGIDWNLDAAHLGDTEWLKAPPGDSRITDEDLTGAFTRLQDRARIADAWGNRSTVRSCDKFRFALPRVVSEGPGQEAGEVAVTAGNGDEYMVRMDRGGFDARVYGPHQGMLSDRMATAFLTDVSESCGGNTDPDDLKYALMYSLSEGRGEAW